MESIVGLPEDRTASLSHSIENPDVSIVLVRSVLGTGPKPEEAFGDMGMNSNGVMKIPSGAIVCCGPGNAVPWISF